MIDKEINNRTSFYRNANSIRIKWTVLLLAIFSGVVLGYLFSCVDENLQDGTLPIGIKESYVAVLPFKNNTGKQAMEVIGEMAADWITSGLHETGEGKILSVGEVNEMVGAVKRQNISLRHANASQRPVHYLIEGAYYEMDSVLFFSSHVKDLKTGEIVFSFPIIEGESDNPTASIELLKQRILGYWVTKDRAGYERRPPVYEAYKAYLEGGKTWYDNPKKATELMKKATELDTNFHYAAFGYIHRLISGPHKAKADSMIAVYQNKKEQLSRMELEFLNGLQNRIARNHEQLWKHWNSPFMEAYWGRNFVIKQKTGLLLGYYSQPEYALELLKQVDFSALDYQEDPLAIMLYLRKTEALFQVGRTEEAKEMWVNMPLKEPNNYIVGKKIFGLALLKAYDELEQEIKHHSESTASSQYPSHYFRAAAVLGLLGTDDLETAEKEARKYLTYLERENKDWRPGPDGLEAPLVQATFYLALQETEKARPIIEKGTGLDESDHAVLALKGIYFAQMNNETAARAIIRQLEEQKSKYDYGKTEMMIATVETWLGNHDKAISLLSEAREKGSLLWYYFYDGDWRLRPLFDHPDFKEKVLAQIPLPVLDQPENRTGQAASYGLYILLLFTAGLAYYFFQRKNQQHPSTQQADAPNPEESVLTETEEDEFLAKLNDVVASKMNDANFNMAQLCKAMGVSRAQVYRKIKSLTGQSPAVYIRSLKLQKAKELLQTTNLNISEIAFEVGFKDLSYFSRSFSEEYGIAPSETRK